MTRPLFKQPQQIPILSLHSYMADRANTVNRAEFDQLKAIVKECTDKTNDIITKTNDLIDDNETFIVVFDKLYTCIYPTGTVYYSSMDPETFMTYQKDYGVYGYFSGNWGYTPQPVAHHQFVWFDPVDPNSPEETWEELNNRPSVGEEINEPTQPEVKKGERVETIVGAGAAYVNPYDTDPPTEINKGRKHVMTIPIYAYWCQKEEPLPSDLKPPVPVDPIEEANFEKQK